jgi:hypothetical protein
MDYEYPVKIIVNMLLAATGERRPQILLALSFVLATCSGWEHVG